MTNRVIAGLLAGAAGASALNAVTYADMAVRGRGSSGMPAQLAGTIAEGVGLDLGEEDTAENRRQGLGGLLGILVGAGVGAAYGALDALVGGETTSSNGEVVASALALAVVAMLASDVPATLAGLTDPRDWPAESWISDAVPHLAYGAVTALTYDRLTHRRR
jgi:hypothetical protein